MGENVTGKNDYYKSGRGIACWGDSMTEGMGSDEGYILTDVGRVDISYYTSPYTIERLTVIEHITWECQVKNQMRFQDVQADLGCILTEIYI